MEEKFGDGRSQLSVCIRDRRRTICSTELLEAVVRHKGFGSALPIMVLMAEEAAILRRPDFGWLPVMALLAGLDAGNQNVGGLFAIDRLCVAGLAIDADVRVVTESRIWQPHRLDARRSNFRQAGESVLIDLGVLERVALLTGFMPEQVLRSFRTKLYPFVGAARDFDCLRFARHGAAKHEANRARRFMDLFGMLMDVIRQLVDDKVVDDLRLIVRYRLAEVTIELQRMAALAGACVGWRSHVSAS